MKLAPVLYIPCDFISLGEVNLSNFVPECCFLFCPTFACVKDQMVMLKVVT